MPLLLPILLTVWIHVILPQCWVCILDCWPDWSTPNFSWPGIIIGPTVASKIKATFTTRWVIDLYWSLFTILSRYLLDFSCTVTVIGRSSQPSRSSTTTLWIIYILFLLIRFSILCNKRGIDILRLLSSVIRPSSYVTFFVKPWFLLILLVWRHLNLQIIVVIIFISLEGVLLDNTIILIPHWNTILLWRQ